MLAWGHNTEGQCNIPVGLKDVVEIKAGDFFTAALKNDGTVVAWGINEAGEVSVPPGLTQVASLGGGMFHHSGVIKEDGSLLLWGRNNFGQASAPEDLTNTLLNNSDLSGANLSEANLSFANLKNTNLTGANLTNANLSGANLTGANLNGALISGTNLIGAIGADLTGTILDKPVEFRISARLMRLPSGKADKIKILFSTERTKKYTIESSSDLSKWHSIESNIQGNGQMIERSFDLGDSNHFFRAIKR
jgi:hypothetical protein